VTSVDWSATSAEDDADYLRAVVDQHEAEVGKVQALPQRVEALRARLLTSTQLEALPPPHALISGVLWADTVVELWGKPGCGKSFVAIDWALCVAVGKAWQGHRVRKGRVLYIVGEGLAGVGKRRTAWSYAWRPAEARDDEQGITWLQGAVPFLEIGWVDALCEIVAQERYDLVVVDTLSRAIAGHPENAAETMSALVAAADRVKAAAGGACVLFVHHATKDGTTTRGHSALEGACDVRWKLAKEDRTLTLSNPKTKDEAEAPDRDLQFRVVDLGTLDEDGNATTSCVIESHDRRPGTDERTASESHLLAALRDSFGTTGATGGQLREVGGLPRSTHYRAVNALLASGSVVNSGTDKRPHFHLAAHLKETAQ